MKDGKLDGDLKTRAEAALKALRGKEEVGAGGTAAMPRLVGKADSGLVGMTPQELADIVEDHVKESGRRPPVRIKDSAREFPFKLPANAYGALVDGEIWINAAAHKARADVIATLRHEYTHFGLLAAYGEQQSREHSLSRGKHNSQAVELLHYVFTLIDQVLMGPEIPLRQPSNTAVYETNPCCQPVNRSPLRQA